MPSIAFHRGFAGHSVRSNPWNPNQFVVAAADNFGVTGSGKVYLVDTPPNLVGGPAQIVGSFGTSDGAFDACFSEIDGSVVVVACGDGVKTYALPQIVNRDGAQPVAYSAEHQAEVSCVTWNQVAKDSFYTSSWDGTVKVWAAAQPQASVLTCRDHLKEVYEVSPSTRDANLFLSCSGDGMWKLWDSRRGGQSALGAPGHDGQIILSVDWNKYDGNVFATSGTDRLAKLWDLRKPQREVFVFRGHEGPVRRVRFSPHARTQLATSGYDFRICVWDLARPQRPMTQRYEQHREFVVGLDWSLAVPGGIASASWDGLGFFWIVGQPPTASHMAHPPLPPALPPPRNPNVRRRPQGAPGPMVR